MATQTSAWWPLVVKVFAPLITQEALDFAATVRVPPASEPASGSVSDQQPSFLPCASGTMYFCFCASVPNL
jgi:hypothetical protein